MAFAKSAPSNIAFQPMVTASQSGMPPVAVKPFPLAGSSSRPRTKAELKTPPGGHDSMVVPTGSPQHSGTESFNLGGDDVLPPEDPD